jgi:hypothetical protein
MNNINSGSEYADLLINTLQEEDDTIPEEHRMPSEVMNYWIKEIKSYANETYTSYILGERDSYQFSDDEISELYERATIQYTNDILEGLIDKGLVEMSVGKTGDILFGLSDEGRKVVE